jgi:membrane fusion protein (multidrug efflux system)
MSSPSGSPAGRRRFASPAPPPEGRIRRRFHSLCLAACGVAFFAGCEPAAPQAALPPPSSGPPAVPVTAVAVQTLARSMRLPGELLAWRDVAIYARTPGFIEKIEVDRGSRVKQGQNLVQLVAPELAAARLEAEAKVASDEATFRRLKEAAATPGVVSKNDLDVADRLVEAGRQRVKAWQQQEAYLRISAPFDGVVTERNVHEGSLVAPSGAGSMPMLRVQEVSRLRLVVAVPEAAAVGTTEGEGVTFEVPAFPGVPFTGKIARQAHALDPKTRTMPVELDVENGTGKLAPGMFADVQWRMKRAEPTLFVPASAIVTTTERTFVIRVRERKAEWVTVRQGVTLSPSAVEVFGALSGGDWVATRGTDELRSGTEVKEPVPPKPSSAP